MKLFRKVNLDCYALGHPHSSHRTIPSEHKPDPGPQSTTLTQQQGVTKKHSDLRGLKKIKHSRRSGTKCRWKSAEEPIVHSSIHTIISQEIILLLLLSPPVIMWQSSLWYTPWLPNKKDLQNNNHMSNQAIHWIVNSCDDLEWQYLTPSHMLKAKH